MQIAADRRPRPGGILAYAAGKDQRVQTSHLHDIAADSRANAFGKQRQRQSRPFVAGVGCLFDVAVIRGHAGDAQQPGFIIQQLAELLGGFPSFSTSQGRIDGSISPLRVPIITPDWGVKPIEVFTDCPPLMAQTLQPLPRWQLTTRRALSGTPSFSASALLT